MNAPAASLQDARLRRNATASCWIFAGLLWLAGIVATPWEGGTFAWSGDSSEAGYLRELAEHPVQAQIAPVFLHFGFLLVVPAVYGSLGILRGPGRRLGYAGAAFAVLGFATLPGLLISDWFGLAMMQNLTPEQALTVHLAVGEYPISLLIFIPTMVGAFVGLGLLLAGLWRAKAIPLWVAIVAFAGLLAGQFTPPTLLARSVATIVMAIGFGAVAVFLHNVGANEWAAGATARPSANPMPAIPRVPVARVPK